MPATAPDLWSSSSQQQWRAALDGYKGVIAMQGVTKLAELDDWYCDELPAAIASRKQPHIVHSELVKLTEWKMARGVWRAPNLVLVRSNDADNVIAITTEALAKVPHPTSPIAAIATLDGVGPATASAVTAAFAPELYPFFDELVAAQIPALGKVAWTLGYYAKYATALRDRASELGNSWTPVTVERALWTNVGGKAKII